MNAPKRKRPISRKLSAQKQRAAKRAPRFRVMPLTMTMLALLLVMKLNDLYIGSTMLRDALSISQAVAEDAPAEKPKEEAKKSDKKSDKKEGEAASGKEEEPEKTLGRGKKTIEEIEAIKAKQNTERLSPVEMDLLQNLSARREMLDAREKDLDLKAKILSATEDRINGRIGEMKKLQDELQTVLNQYKNQQDSEIRGLVKIYENMKPVDAASIFNELDIDILLSVVDKMSERKVAPVLAAMNPLRAKDVTERLAELRQLRSQAAKKAIDLTEQPAPAPAQ